MKREHFISLALLLVTILTTALADPIMNADDTLIYDVSANGTVSVLEILPAGTPYSLLSPFRPEVGTPCSDYFAATLGEAQPLLYAVSYTLNGLNREGFMLESYVRNQIIIEDNDGQENAQDSHTLRYYHNPKGGQYRHIDAKCASVSVKYLPLQPATGALLERLPPCPYCLADTAPIFSASGGAVNLPNLQANVYPTSLQIPGWEKAPAYRLYIENKDDPAHVFDELLFPSLEGAEALAPLVRIEDVNFDGFPDLMALRAQGASNTFSTFFLYNPADGQYRYEPTLDDLSNYVLYPEQRIISNNVHDSALTGMRGLYRVDEGGRPVLFRQAEALYDEQSGYQKLHRKITSFDPYGAATVLMDEVLDVPMDDVQFLENEWEWLGVFYGGIDADVVKGDLGPNAATKMVE